MPKQSIEGFQISPQQERLWSLQQGDQRLPYQARCAVLIEGDLDINALKAALGDVVERHEILRTSFHCLPSMAFPLQVISDAVALPLPEYDLQHLDAQQQAAFSDRLLDGAGRRSFKLDEAPLLKVALVVLSPERHMLLISVPTLCADTESLERIVREISDSYGAFQEHRRLSDASIQYADFAEWQHELLRSEATETGRIYWSKQEIRRFLAQKLPFEKRSRETPAFEPQSLDLALPPDIMARIESLSEIYHVSVSVFLQTCWHILIRRLIGDPDIVVGSCYDNRRDTDLKAAIGLFAIYAPIHSRLEERFRLSEALRQIDTSVSDACTYQEYFSWKYISGESDGARSEDFFPISFDFVEQPANYSTGNTSFSIHRRYACFDRYNLKLACVRVRDAVIAEFHYNIHAFRSDDIARLSRQFLMLLESAVNQPEAPIGALDILSAVERQRLLFEFNDTRVAHPEVKCIHLVFEEQVKRSPDRIAIVFEGRHVTYGELNASANHLAQRLRRLGVGPDVLVALYLERSPELVIGILGILKASGAYVPLDVMLPQERLSLILEDTHAPVIVTCRRLVKRVTGQSAKVICIDTDERRSGYTSDANLASLATPENLVYVMYTSGSTGRPKGVAVEHRQLFNYVSAIGERMGLPAGVSFAIVSTFSADLGNTVLFPSLTTGGCLHIISAERAADPEALAEYFRRHPIDCLKIVPSHLVMLLSSPHPEGALPRLQMVLGGEAARWDVLEKLRTLAPGCRILNHYGPTEATVGAQSYRVERNQRSPAGPTVPLGQPLANIQIYVLNPYLRPAPIGVPGEVYIGGVGLARGYLDRPDLTAERFIPNPFGQASEVRSQALENEGPRTNAGVAPILNPQFPIQHGSRLYRTGDLARHRSDGVIEFLGRTDYQVKLRGFRIELGEIEAILLEHPTVRQAVVTMREDTPSDTRLVAYVVQRPGLQPVAFDPQELLAFLKERLPDYMAPAHIIPLDALPLTPNGKVKRDALPAPDRARTGRRGAFVAPRSALELQLARIWEDILALQPIGMRDNFFALGGHSLLAVRLLAQIQRQFNQVIPLSAFFQSATIEQLASTLRQQIGPRLQSPLVALQPAGAKPPFFCVHPLGGSALSYLSLARRMGTDRPFYGLQARGVDGEAEPFTSIADMAAHYVEALLGVQPEGPYLIGGWSMGGVLAFEMAQQLYKQGRIVALLALLDIDAPRAGEAVADFDQARELVRLVNGMARVNKQAPPVSYDELRHLEPDEQAKFVLERLKQADLAPPDMDLAHLLPLMRLRINTLHAKHHYVPQIYPGRITLFRASEWQPEDSSYEDGDRSRADDPALGWSALSSQAVNVHVVPGTHETIVEEPHVQTLADRLRACLEA